MTGRFLLELDLKMTDKKNLVQLSLALACTISTHVFAADNSAPAMIQYFESQWRTVETRTPDIFNAGYGGIWIPPAYRADTGNQSVGYDLYDRFDLGYAGNPTLYGTENTLKQMASSMHRIGGSVYADAIWNHNGFNDQSNNAFVNSGGYPGFVMSVSGNPNGDFHAWNASDVLDERVSGLIDIAQESNNLFVRNPLPNPTDANGNPLTNLPAGTSTYAGRIANVPTEANRRFYQDRNGSADRTLFNPYTNETVSRYNFDPTSATTGDATLENATGYLMRHAQWMIQQVGVDGFRLDATKHIPVWVFNQYFDQAVYQVNPRLNLDGSIKNTFSFGELFDGNKQYLQTYIRKDIDPGQPNTIGGNRDTLDFPLFFAMNDNLTHNGVNNDWRNVVNSSIDVQDDGLANNGSQGVAFVQSHDSFGPYLNNVAYAYTLMRPGNALVYFNAEEFGTNREFPKDGRGDALGGMYGNTITKLVNARNTHGRGNYLERWIDKETLVYEREKSAIVALSNRVDNGYDARTVQTSFPPGTRLIEMTGNADDANVDPTHAIANFVIVDPQGRISFNLPRNRNVNGSEHLKGYVIYGLPTPRGTMSIIGASQIIAGENPTASTNDTARLASIDVVTSDSFQLKLATIPVVIDGYTDTNAGGDNAIFSVNSGANENGIGVDLNSNGAVDFTSPGSVVYGFEQFVTKRSPLVSGGDGEYIQTLDARKLIEGYNYVEVRAFRSRPANEPVVYSSFKKTIYVDRLDAIANLDEVQTTTGNNRRVLIENPDHTATSINMLFDLGAAINVNAQVGPGNLTTQIDRDLFQSPQLNNVGTGYHVLTFVTQEITGRTSIKRLPGVWIQTARGLGLGDIDFNNAYSSADVLNFETVLYSRDDLFNPAGDLVIDGLIDNRDLFLLPFQYTNLGQPAVASAARQAVVRRGNLNEDLITDSTDIDTLFDHLGDTGDIWLFDLNVDHAVTTADVDTMLETILLTTYGDTNLDRRVDFTDLLTTAQSYGETTGRTWATGDFTGDDRVDFSDLLLVSQNYNFGVSLGAADDFGTALHQLTRLGYVVPEPTALFVPGMLILAGLRRNRRD